MIIVLTGMPGSGKTCLATQLIYDAWKADPSRKIFTNYPVRLGNKSTMIWEPRFMNENIQDSLIVIDEAYRDYNSRKSIRGGDGSLDENTHIQMATNRHNGNTFVLISQNLARLDTVIREIAEIWWITKVARPNLKHLAEFDQWHPLWFKAEMYDCLDSFKMKAIMGKNAAWKTKRWRFRKKIAQMYDTHYFGDTTEQPFITKTWFNVEELPEHVTIKQRVYDAVHSCVEHFNRVPIMAYLTSYTWNNSKNQNLKYDLWEPQPKPKIRVQVMETGMKILLWNYSLWQPLFKKVGIE
ncbi:MAG: zonular occludens toxin domain-containing protein [Anaerolineales bacterium]